MNNNKLYVSAKDILDIFETSTTQGFSIAQFLKKLNLSAQLFDDPLAKIDIEECWRIMTAHQNSINEETHLISTRPLKRGTTQFVFSNLMYGDDLEKGLKILANAYNIVHGGDYNFVRTQGGFLRYIVDDKTFHYREHANHLAIEFALIKIHCVLTYLVGYELKPVKICTKRQPIVFKNHHLDFFDCNICFDHPYYEIIYNKSQSGLPFRSVEKIDLSAHLLSNYQSVINQKKHDNISDPLIKKVINKIRQNIYKQNDVASAVGMSVPTLRRKLKHNGTNFRTIVDKVHSELAANDLLDLIPLSDIANKLGYCDVRSFNRAFKRWHGVSPTMFLKNNRSNTTSL